MRNRIVHGYDAVDNVTVWTAAVKHAPILRSQVEELLREEEEGPERYGRSSNERAANVMSGIATRQLGSDNACVALSWGRRDIQ
jgi:hypothetical protein